MCRGWHCDKGVLQHVDVADNDNKSHASPVHHGHSNWQHLADSPSEAEPRG